MDTGLLIVISGPSGAGKGTVCKRLLEKNDRLRISTSVTTRKPRPHEVEGVHYYFRTMEEFESMVEERQFLEYANVHGNMYGTLRSTVKDILMSGQDMILEIDIQGTLMVKESFPEGVFIFIVPPTMQELKNRITGRGTEDEETILRRFRTAYKELNFISRYNYVVVNDVVEEAVNKIESIITAEKCSVIRNKEIQEKLLEGEE